MENSQPNLVTFGTADAVTLKQMQVCLEDPRAVKGVLCADNHLGYGHPIGGVVAYQNAISISGVGFDIGCGNTAFKTNALASEVKKNINAIMDRIATDIEFGVGSKGNRWADHSFFDTAAFNRTVLPDFKDSARLQLGSVGGGNHYVDLFEDEGGFVWVGVHFGSRGLGHKTASHFMKLLGAKDGFDAPPCVVDVATAIGADYLDQMTMCGLYAQIGRALVCQYVVKNILQAEVIEEIENHHNFVWQEVHAGQHLYVARKGSTPNWTGKKSFVGGSMADSSFILEGTASPDNETALFSTIHGAGRAFSRKKARENFTRQEQSDWCNRVGVCVRGGDVDESPMAYKRINEVLALQGDTVKVLHVLTPIGVAMAGAAVKDPFKD